MTMKEATARIKINKLLEAAGWRFFKNGDLPANVQLEPSVSLKAEDLEGLGENFERVKKGYIDFLLLNEKGCPFIVLEAKAEDKEPLAAKEQARKYARSQNCRFVILSNGNLHYFWDLERGNPYIVTAFPTPTSVLGYQKLVPDPKRLIEEVVEDNYVVLTQRPGYASEAAWRSEDERQRFIEVNGLRFLRPYQMKAIRAIQQSVAKGSDRFLNDYKTIIYKENRDDWRRADIIVTTVQSLLFNNKYQDLFSPTDFDLVISDEAHRSIGGNARAVFNYFIGYKLGLTATPRDYLKKFNKDKPSTKRPARIRASSPSRYISHVRVRRWSTNFSLFASRWC